MSASYTFLASLGEKVSPFCQRGWMSPVSPEKLPGVKNLLFPPHTLWYEKKMGDNSIVSILILLVLFIVLPSVMKFIGQRTMKGKPAGNEEPQNNHVGQEERLQDYLPLQHPRDDINTPTRYTSSSNKPIHPKWF